MKLTAKLEYNLAIYHNSFYADLSEGAKGDGA
jgi:hypothetical protein